MTIMALVITFMTTPILCAMMIMPLEKRMEGSLSEQ